MTRESKLVHHSLKPFYRNDSEVLILGSLPSVKSRELKFYYAHPQNRFWKVMAAVYEEDLASTMEEKKLFLARHKIALWDVIASCQIVGSDDNSITDVTVNDLSLILSHCPIQKIITTGTKAARLYQKYCYPKTKREAISLPSTSPANQKYYPLSNLVIAYKETLKKE